LPQAKSLSDLFFEGQLAIDQPERFLSIKDAQEGIKA